MHNIILYVMYQKTEDNVRDKRNVTFTAAIMGSHACQMFEQLCAHTGACFWGFCAEVDLGMLFLFRIWEFFYYNLG